MCAVCSVLSWTGYRCMLCAVIDSSTSAKHSSFAKSLPGLHSFTNRWKPAFPDRSSTPQVARPMASIAVLVDRPDSARRDSLSQRSLSSPGKEKTKMLTQMCDILIFKMQIRTFFHFKYSDAKLRIIEYLLSASKKVIIDKT